MRSCNTCWLEDPILIICLLCRESVHAMSARLQQMEESAGSSHKLLAARVMQLEEAAANQVCVFFDIFLV